MMTFPLPLLVVGIGT